VTQAPSRAEWGALVRGIGRVVEIMPLLRLQLLRGDLDGQG
jgi:hypothetical protein